MADKRETLELPLLPLRDVVVYPHMVIPLFVGRDKSIRALELAMADNKEIILEYVKFSKKIHPSGSEKISKYNKSIS